MNSRKNAIEHSALSFRRTGLFLLGAILVLACASSASAYVNASGNTVIDFPGGTVKITGFPSGNINKTFSSGEGSWFANVTGGTVFVKNDKGTYNTVTTPVPDSNSPFASPNKNRPPQCPPGTTLERTTTGSGKGARTVRTCVPPPSSCPAGQVMQNGHCTTPTPTCPRGQQTQNGHCVTTPTCPQGQQAQNGTCTVITHRSCTLDGRTIVDGGHWTFFSHRTVAAGQLCSSFDQVRTCTDGSLSGSASFRYQSCAVDQAQNTATAPIISITATPSIVRLGGSSKIVWDGGLATSCSVSGPGLSATSIRGSKIITNIQEQSVYLLSCATGAAAAEDSATVDIVPIWREY